MRVTIADNVWSYLDQVTTDQEAELEREFSVQHPKHRFINEGQAWDGYYHMYQARTGRLSRSFLNDLIAFCEKNDYPLEIRDIRPNPKYHYSEINEDFIDGVMLERYQIEAIEICRNEEVGIISCPTGGGKTFIIAGIIKACKCPTIVIADQLIIIDQIKECLELKKVVDEAGLFYGGRTPTGQLVCIGSIQSAKKYRKLISECHLLIVDEADRAVSKQYRQVFLKYSPKARRRYGLTGTPFDPNKPVENMRLREHLGNIIYSVERRQVEKAGLSVPIRYYMVSIGEDGDRNNKAAHDIAVSRYMVENQVFHDSVKRIVDAFPDDGTLVLVELTELGHKLEELIPGSKFVYGQTSKTDRRKYIRMFEERKIKCLIGGKIFIRGVDLKGGCENLVICTGGKLSSELAQKIGRAVRRNRRDIARVFDFYFLCNFYLYRNSRARLKAALSLGYPAKVILSDREVDGNRLVRSRFRIPRRTQKVRQTKLLF